MSHRPQRLAAAVVVFAAVAVSFSVSPAHAVPDNYVALGDSYSSGVGTGSYSLNSACKRSAYAYPYLVAQQRPNTSLTFVACTGATTADVMSKQISSVTLSTNVVTISIGGNDLGFSSLITTCITADCNTALNTTRTSAATVLAPKLDTVYAAIKGRAAPGAKVVVLGYPRLFSTASCFASTGVSTAERSNANLLSDEIDRITADRAAAYGFTYKSATSAFTGHAVCASGTWINGLILFNPGESYHPTRAGQSSGYLPLVRSVVG